MAVTAATVKALQATAAFAGASAPGLNIVLHDAERVSVSEGGTFFGEGDQGDGFYLLESGRVEIIKTRGGITRVLGDLGEGDVFGEMAILGVMWRSATVRALSDCVAIRVTSRGLSALYDQDPQVFALIVMNLGREVCRRLRDLNDRLLSQAIGSE